MAISSAEKLRRFYQQFSNEDRVAILINADPDAVASAMAVKRLLWRKVAQAAVAHVNAISRPDNLAMIRLLGVSLTPVEQIDPQRFSRFVLVDSQPGHHEMFSKFQFQVIIDHHPDTDPKAPFQDIRPCYGATATILTEYLRASGIKPSAKLATALFYAIKTDTSNFARQASLDDIRAFQFLFRHSNLHLARKIEHADIRLDYLKYFRFALETMQMRRGKVFVHLGNVVNPDVCVLIAEFFMRVTPVEWSIVSGIFDKKLIIVFRNDGIRKDAGKTARKSFSAIGSAGGHKSMARAEIPAETIETAPGLQDHKKLQSWIIEQIEQKGKIFHSRKKG
jgi:nanoRNase/pAp phosphatase (c-di-AMP/oligoRNAs hydrolase)